VIPSIQQAPEGTPDPPEVLIPLRSLRRERAQVFQKLQHAVPAAGLLLVGVQGILRHENGVELALSAVEIVVSVLLVRSLAKAFAANRRSRRAAAAGHGAPAGHGHGHGVDWVDVLVASVLAVEALEHWHTHHHIQGPTILLALVTLGLGLFHGRLAARTAHRRSLQIGATGIQINRRFFRRFSASWQDLESIDVDERWARLVARGGRERRIDLKDLANGAEVRQALVAARERIAPPSAEAPA
jgi:hypothetical protein